MKALFLMFATFLLTLFGVEIFRRWTLRRQIFDIPNERSSHQTPTPRGGGLIIVAVCLLSYLVYSVYNNNFASGYFIGAFLIALVSWFDDLKSVPSAVRFLVHAAAAAFAVLSLDYWQTVYLPLVGEINFGTYGAIITILWIIWLTNAYNFMDGIDGIAATQALTAGIGWFVVGHLLNAETIGFYGGVLALSSLGFLFHNWQPARIFMGDVGSAFLGYTFAVLPLLVVSEVKSDYPWLATVAVLFVWLFVFDTFLTFLRRLLGGEKVWQAHRSHFYQRLVISGYSHQFVAWLYGIWSLLIVLSVLLWIIIGRGIDWLPAAVILTVGAGILFLSWRKKQVDVS